MVLKGVWVDSWPGWYAVALELAAPGSPGDGRHSCGTEGVEKSPSAEHAGGGSCCRGRRLLHDVRPRWQGARADQVASLFLVRVPRALTMVASSGCRGRLSREVRSPSGKGFCSTGVVKMENSVFAYTPFFQHEIEFEDRILSFSHGPVNLESASDGDPGRRGYYLITVCFVLSQHRGSMT